MTINAAFHWVCHPKAEALIENLLSDACEKNSFISSLSDQLEKETSTRLFDWIDHIVVGKNPEIEKHLEEYGFVELVAESVGRVFHHPGAQFPRIVIKDRGLPLIGVAVSVERIEDFLMVRGIHKTIEGSLYSPYRRCEIFQENLVTLWVVERRGFVGMVPVKSDEDYLDKYFTAKEKWKTRPRIHLNENKALDQTLLLADEVVSLVGRDLAASIVLECEREYWQARNTAAQIQKSRQDRLGMGWANHDHHTFRSTRTHFWKLVRLFEILGFHCRERYYTGKEAGWGAQIMENANCRLVVFLDVDLAPEEVEVDFAHDPLPTLKQVGTIGLWCGLHGDSILKAGMHHLEAQFMFDELKGDLEQKGIGMMEPFSSFPYLKQAFTKGEMWSVDPARIETLLDSKKITQEQADKFSTYGALGSHLENLQRREGYKGFNQKNVSFIIKKTDPRHNENLKKGE